ncbi:MAG: lysophospholipase [Actinomycetota bacterium]
MIENIARPEPAPDGGAQLVRDWSPPSGEVKGDMVLVHGIAEHSGRYGHVGSWLAEAGYRVRGFDLLGFGASSGERGAVSKWSLYLDQVEGHLDAMRTPGRPLILFGHSMGGQIATEYALSERPQPDLLVLSSPSLSGGKTWQRKAANFLGRVLPKLSLPTMVKGEQLARDPAVGEKYFSDPLCMTKVTTRLGAQLFASQARINESLDRLRIPTFVFHGEDDTLVPPEASAPLAALPGVERRLLHSLRHETCNEPEGRDVISEVIDWLEAKRTS